jgi:hypothetical protein
MIEAIKKIISKGFLHFAALIIVAVVAGPELLISMQLMGMIEVLGVSAFVGMYLSGFKLFMASAKSRYRRFESHSISFVPTFDALKKMPSLAMHLIPERSAIISFICLVLAMPFIFIIQTAI